MAAVALGLSLWAVINTGRLMAPYELAKPKTLSLPPLVEMDPRVIDVLTMGHRGLYDDFINIWAIQILMDEATRREKPDDVADALAKITRHAPKLESLYMLTCFVMALDLKRPDLCVRFTMDGLAAFPHSWKIPMTQASVLAFRMRKPAEAAPFFELAGSKPGAPPYFTSLAKKLREKAAVTSDELSKGLDYLDELPGGTRLKEAILEDNARGESAP